jgi:hypothetical protein
MRAVWYVWREVKRGPWRAVITVALIGGLLGAVALGATAGARRTGSAYGRYLRSIRASDVFVNVPVPSLSFIRQVEKLPGTAGPPAAWVGINADPVVHGHVDSSFLHGSVVGSLDGEYSRQDRMSVDAGRLPVRDDEVALTRLEARFFGVGVGGHATFQLFRKRSSSPPPIRPPGPTHRGAPIRERMSGSRPEGSASCSAHGRW